MLLPPNALPTYEELEAREQSRLLAEAILKTAYNAVLPWDAGVVQMSGVERSLVDYTRKTYLEFQNFHFLDFELAIPEDVLDDPNTILQIVHDKVTKRLESFQNESVPDNVELSEG